MDSAHRIRILYVITDLKLGGVPLHLLRLAKAMRDQGIQLTVASLAPSGPVSERLAEEGIPIWALDARGPWDWRVFERLAQLIAELNPDVVHSLLFHANVAARAACVLGGFPASRLICEIQTAEIERPWHLTVDRWTQRFCRVIVGNSPSVIEHLSEAGGIHPSRLRLISGGVDPEPIRNAAPLPRWELGLDTNAPVLLWVGRLDPVKGLDELIEAFSRVAAKRACWLLLAGVGAYRPCVEARAAATACADRIHLLGPRTDVPRLLRSADLFVFPSRTEGMPNALLEAMAAGLPCVASNVSGCRDVLRHQVDGLLVPPNDPPSLVDAIERLLDDPALARRLGARAAVTIERSFHISATHQAYRRLYEEVAHRPGTFPTSHM